MKTADLARIKVVEAARRKAEAHVERARRHNHRAVVIAVVASSVSAFLTGIPAALGDPIAGTWRVTCMIASAFAAVAAITTGLQAQLRYADQLTSATECLGRLRSLDVQAALGVLTQEDLARQFAEVIARYPEYV